MWIRPVFICLMALAAILAPCPAATGELKYELPDFEMELALVGAVFPPGTQPGPRNPSLLMDLSRYGDRWDRVWISARNYNVAIHTGHVEQARIDEKQVFLKLRVRMESDSWVEGGRGTYEVTLNRLPDGRLAGEYAGEFVRQPVKGEAFGRVRPRQPPMPGYVPVQPGEHPRILFRKSDVPRLRQRAQTELGRAALSLMGSTEGCGDAIGMGVKYHATGDPQWAQHAREATAKHMADQSVPAFARGRQWGPRLEQVAVAYDLCYDAWPEDFRKQVESYLRFICNQVFFDPNKLGGTINWTVGSNYAGPIYAGVGFAGLALWGEKGPQPVKPAEPAIVEAIPPAQDYTPPDGVPVVPMEYGRSPSAWLITEGMPFGLATDPMVSLNGLESLRPKPGDKVRIEHHETVFQPIDPKHVGANGGISLRTGLKKGRVLSLLAYTVINVPDARHVKIRAPFSKSGRVQVVLNGMRVEHEQVVRLEKGLYPMLVALRLGVDWTSLEPWFEQATDEDARKYRQTIAVRKQEYQEQLKDWEFDMQQWTRLGGADLNFLRIHEQGRRMMYLFCREACGTGGYQTESGHYFNDGIDGPDRYAAGYRTMFGQDISTFFDIAAYIPRMIAATVYPDNGKSRHLNISSAASANGERIAALFPIIPDRLKPAVLWHWNREVGGSVDKPDLAKIARANPVYSLLYYPLDMKPQHPGSVMPLTWEAPDRGYYMFRNAWRGGDDIVFQFLGRCRGTHGWGGPDGGTFRLQGLSAVWATGNTGREVRRWLENVVNLPEDPEMRFGSIGRVTYARLDPDGSGAVTYDYTDSCYRNDDKQAPFMEAYGGIMRPGTSRPLATALRAVAIDYSGKCGAPALLAIVDRIEGGKGKEWLWHVVDPDAVKTDERGFTISAGDASLRAVFVAPARPALEVAREGRKTTKSAGHMAGSAITLNIKAVVARNQQDATDGRFFVVATLQKGQPPPVSVTGAGLDARVTVGGRVVRFDGQKIIVE